MLARSLRRLLPVLLATLAAAGGLTACSSGGSGDRLTVYSGRLQELIGPLLDRFSRETGIGIDVRYGDSSDLALLIDEEGDRSPADVFLSQAPGAMGYLDQRHRLQPLPPALLDLVDPRFRADDGRWIGVSGRVRVLVYNTERVDTADLPASVFDLTRPRYRDRLAIAPTNASFQDFVTAMRSAVGDARTKDWLVGLKDNGVRSYANNLAIVDAVGRGVVDMGLVNDYYLYEVQRDDPSIPASNFYFPNADLGSLILTTTVGVLDTAGDRAAAQRFIRYLLSPAAQRFYARQTFEYPLAGGVEPAPGKPPLSSIQSPTVDLSSLGGGLKATRRLIAESGLESS